MLHEFLSRFYDGTYLESILEAIKLATLGVSQLTIFGHDDPLAMAVGIARRCKPGPIVISDPRRHMVPETVRGPRNELTARAALDAARGGTLLLRRSRLPHDFEIIVEDLRQTHDVMLIILSDQDMWSALVKPTPIFVPTLDEVRIKIPEIIDGYVNDAIEELNALEGCIDDSDKLWISAVATSILDVQKIALRLVAVRRSKNLSAAAERLGMAPVSLHRWMVRHRYK